MYTDRVRENEVAFANFMTKSFVDMTGYFTLTLKLKAVAVT